MRVIVTMLVLFLAFPNVADCQTLQKPKYSPSKEKHKNRTDELGRKQGLWKHYNMDGVLIWEVGYLDDRKHGVSKRFYMNGRIMRETEYQFGRKDGLFKRYGYDGVTTEGEYDEGKKVNRWTNYYTNGQVKSEGLYVNSMKSGEWKYYNHKGLLVNSIVYKEGKDLRMIAAEEKKKEEARKAAKSKATLSRK